MADTKILNRVKLPLKAKTRQELVQKQLANNLARDKEFNYTDFQYLPHEKIYLCWYFDELKPGEPRVIE